MTIDVIRLAKEAHIDLELHVSIGREPVWIATQDELERFTALAMEECAKVASNYGPSRPIMGKNPSSKIVGRWEGEQAASYGISAAIRARKPA